MRSNIINNSNLKKQDIYIMNDILIYSIVGISIIIIVIIVVVIFILDSDEVTPTHHQYCSSMVVLVSGLIMMIANFAPQHALKANMENHHV